MIALEGQNACGFQQFVRFLEATEFCPSLIWTRQAHLKKGKKNDVFIVKTNQDDKMVELD